jgi:hypothetical protein
VIGKVLRKSVENKWKILAKGWMGDRFTPWDGFERGGPNLKDSKGLGNARSSERAVEKYLKGYARDPASTLAEREDLSAQKPPLSLS